MRFLCWCLIAAGATGQFAAGQLGAPEEGSLAKVTVIVSDTFGEPVPGARITLTSVGPNESFSAVGGEAKLERVPYGLYDLQVRLTGFLTRQVRVRVYQPDLILRTGLELAPGHSYRRPEISGSVKPVVQGRSDLWVRLVALYSSDLVENAVDPSGKFELVGMAPGRYLLLLLQKDKLLEQEPVDVLGGKQVVDLTVEPQ